MHPAQSTWASLQGLVLVLFLTYIIGDIFPVFQSGNPQPSDFVMALVVGSVVTGLAFKIRESHRILALLALLLFWIWQVNFFHYSFDESASHATGWWSTAHFLWSNAYYLFNIGIFLAVSTLFQHFNTTFIRSVRVTLLLTLMLEVAAVIVISSDAAPREPGLYRSVGTYEDPNQLAYWAILALCSLLVLAPQERLGGVEIAGIVAATFIVLSSLSRSGALGLTIVVLVALTTLRIRAALALLACAAVLAIILSWSNTRFIGALFEQGEAAQLASRFSENDGDDDLAGRGYERLWRFPEHLFLGAGEGAYRRFRGGTFSETEFHSTLGSMLFSYGIVGLGLFGCFLWEVFRRAPLRHKAYFLGPMAWGLFNYGGRFSTFWVFLALVYASSIARARSTG